MTMRRAGAVALSLALWGAAPSVALADTLYQESLNDNLTSFSRPYLGVGNIVTVQVTEQNTAESGASTNRSKDARIRGEWDFGNLFPQLGGLSTNTSEIRGRDDFQGQGITSRNGRLQMDVSCRIEEVLPNGTLRVVGKKSIRVNDEETEITIRGIIRPLDISVDNRIASSRVADMQVDFRGSGPNTAKATPGLLTRLFNWLW